MEDTTLAKEISHLEGELRGVKTSQPYVLTQVATYTTPTIHLEPYWYTSPTGNSYREIAAIFKFTGDSPSKIAMGIIKSTLNNAQQGDMLLWKSFLNPGANNVLRFGVVYLFLSNSSASVDVGITTNMDGFIELEGTYQLNLGG